MGANILCKTKYTEEEVRKILHDYHKDSAYIVDKYIYTAKSNPDLFNELINGQYTPEYSMIILNYWIDKKIDVLAVIKCKDLNILDIFSKLDESYRKYLNKRATTTLNKDLVPKFIQINLNLKDYSHVEFDDSKLEIVANIAKKNLILTPLMAKTFNKDQLHMIEKYYTDEKQQDFIDPRFDADTLRLLLENTSNGILNISDMLKLYDKYKENTHILVNYTRVKKICSKEISDYEKACAISRLIPRSMVGQLFKLLPEEDPVEIIMNKYKKKSNAWIYNKYLDSLSEFKLEFPFMKAAIKQFEEIGEELGKRCIAIEDAKEDIKEKQLIDKAKERQKRYLDEGTPYVLGYISLYRACETNKTDLPNVASYCKDIGITYSMFTRYVKALRDTGNSIYKEYQEIITVKRKRVSAILMGKAESVLKNIKKDPKNYSVYDYFSDTKMSPDSMKNIIKLSHFEDTYRIAFDQWVDKHQNDLFEHNRNWFYTENIVIKGHVCTRAEKKEALDRMQRDKFPKCVSIYKRYLREVISENISKETE